LRHFASGTKRSYYGKADVIAYRLDRATETIFGANVTMLLYGDAFWTTYTTGDNTGLIATDSMKNFIQRETLNCDGSDLESYCGFLAAKFLFTYPQTEGVVVEALEVPYAGDGVFRPGGPERAFARVEMRREGVVELRSGIRGFKLLRLSGSSFQGFVRDQYTTLPELADRPLHMWLDVEWTYTAAEDVAAHVREIIQDTFANFESGSIQQVIFKMGNRILDELPGIAEVTLEANNRTWDRVAESGENLAVYTDPRPPYGVLGLTLRR
jgi:urate oxidase